MRFYNYALTILSLIVVQGIDAQITVDPAFPQQTETITVTYDASKGTGGLKDCNCDVYIHSGLITAESSNLSDWKFVRTVWGQDNPAWKMTRVAGSANLYKITIDIPRFYDFPVGTVVRKLAFVFRDATGGREGKAEGGGDIYYDIAPANAPFQVRIQSPTSNNTLLDVGSTLVVSATASEPVSKYEIFDNGQSIALVTGQNDLRQNVSVLAGSHQLRLVATSTGGDTSSARVSYFGLADLAAVALPAGIEPGYTSLAGGRSAYYLYAPGKRRAIVRLSTEGFEFRSGRQMAPLSNGLGFYLEMATPAGGNFAYQYIVDDAPAIADPFSELVLDPFNDRFITGVGFDNILTVPQEVGISTWIRPEVPFTWTNDAYDRPADKELVIYELLIRDFTSKHSYQSLIDSLAYFQRLGINAIELMPINEFENNESWGYNPSYHMALDKYYGPPEDLKAFVDAAHGIGIAVIVDVVFNHAFGQNPYVQLYAKETAAAADGAGPFFNRTARHPFNVGEDFNHESINTKRYVGRILRYMIEEFHIDGYRFDLSKGFTQVNYGGDVGAWGRYDASRIAILKAYQDSIRAVDPSSYVILEHFAENREERELTAAGMFVWGNMNNNYLEAAMGYAGNSLYGVTPQSRGFDNPRLVGYMESHDEERMLYKIFAFGNSGPGYSTKDYNIAHARAELASAFFYTTPGAKMLWQFGEFGYPISIDENGRTGNKPILWSLLEREANKRLFNVTASLIKLRRDYPTFVDGTSNLAEGLAAGPVKSLTIRHSEMDAVVVGNFDVTEKTVQATFPGGGTYYDYFKGGELATSAGTTDVTMSIALKPGEYRLYTDRKLPPPQGGYLGDVVGLGAGLPVGAAVGILGNPSSETLSLEVRGWDQPLQLRIYDAQGRISLSQNLRGGTTHVIATPGLAAGTYLATLSDEAGHSWSALWQRL